ncbi:MAG: hypothetical protein WC279_06315, partial [Sulfurimonas sp.]|uniref:hypothetical protein n=1 Tax=Sulfurimonas sp. TaxID=2022749 RepID=UPI003567E632
SLANCSTSISIFMYLSLGICYFTRLTQNFEWSPHRKYNLPIKPEQRKILNLWLKESKERVAMAKQVQQHFSN